jgi:hypothetical protein
MISITTIQSILIVTTPILIALAALVVSFLAIRENRKGLQFQRFLSLVEKESTYASDFVHQQTLGNENLMDDKLIQYLNLFEVLAICFIQKEVPQKITEDYFRTILQGTYGAYTKEIDTKIASGDEYTWLNKLLHRWNLK